MDEAGLERIRKDLDEFFTRRKKTFYGGSTRYEDNAHLNLIELRDEMRDISSLVDMDDSPLLQKDFSVWGLLISIVPRADSFNGKHGTGLITYGEFLSVMEQAELSNQLVYKTVSMAALDESIDFNTDELVIQQVASATSEPSPGVANMNKHYLKAIGEDAQKLVENFKDSYGSQNTELTPI